MTKKKLWTSNDYYIYNHSTKFERDNWMVLNKLRANYDLYVLAENFRYFVEFVLCSPFCVSSLLLRKVDQCHSHALSACLAFHDQDVPEKYPADISKIKLTRTILIIRFESTTKHGNSKVSNFEILS